jgi:DNA-binding beta-propeller fold protein YncE
MSSWPGSLVSVTALTIVLLAGACAPQEAVDEQEAIDQQEAVDEKTYILATGRRLPYLYAISVEDAVDPANNDTPNAILSRNKVALDRLDGQLLGDPANLAVSEDGGTAYVVNHHGGIDNAEYRQHGGRGQIAVMDLDEMLKPENDRTANALRWHFDSGSFGAVGILLLPDMLIMSNAENNQTEDGGNRVTFVDRRTGSLRGTVELAMGSPGFDCPEYPVPFVSPHGPPRGLAVLSPDPSWGCFPDNNGLALGRDSGGKAFMFTANGGTDDVSVIDLARALEGDRLAEVHRVPTQVGPWGIANTPDGRHIIAANRESQQVAFEGNTISIIDADLASTGSEGAEVARVLVGTDDPDEQTRPFIPSVTPDGREVIVPNFRANNVSIVSLEMALAGDPGAEVARIPLTRSDGLPARPKGSAVTADGRYAVISAGPSTPPFSEALGHVYVIDLFSRTVVGVVTGVGNDPYGLAVVDR